MNGLSSNAMRMTNRAFYRQRENAVLMQIPGITEVVRATPEQRVLLGEKYPDAVFALQIISNPFIQDNELGAIQMQAYSAILNGDTIADVRYKYNRQMDNYFEQHTWD